MSNKQLILMLDMILEIIKSSNSLDEAIKKVEAFANQL